MRFLICTLFLLISTLSIAQDLDLVGQLKDLTQRHFEAMEAENIEQVEATFHPDTPILGQTLLMARQLAATYDLEHSVGNHWIYVGQDSDYAYARIEQETRKLSGPAFSDNAVDQIWVFRQFEGEWRIWTTGVIDVDFLVRPISDTMRRRSTYRSMDLVFNFTDTEVVDCESHPEFASVLSSAKAVCGVTKAAWEEFSSFELSLWSDDQLAPENWKGSSEERYAVYFDEGDEINLKLSYIEGGFITVVPLSQ